MERTDEGSQTPAQRMEKALKAWLEEFKKTPYVYPVSIAVAAGVYYLTLVYAANVCLINLVTPLVLLGILWWFGVKNVRKLLVIGLVAVLVLSGIWLVAYTQFYTGLEPGVALSEDGSTMNGTVEPFRGASGQVYNFTLTVQVDNSTGVPIYFKNVTTYLQSVQFPGTAISNNTMTLYRNDTENLTQYYYYTSTLPAINAYAFLAVYPNGSLEIAGEWSAGGVSLVQGPFPTDTNAIVVALLPFSFMQTLINVYVAFLLIVGMIWWTRRARRMREKQIESWQKEEAEKEAAQPKSSQLKVPSLAKAMGKDEEAGDTFVCSECGADVPADATVCPKCGEKFD